jgi:hypothetical protein
MQSMPADTLTEYGRPRLGRRSLHLLRRQTLLDLESGLLERLG